MFEDPLKTIVIAMYVALGLALITPVLLVVIVYLLVKS